jgi:hypothetical protein
MAGCRSTFFPKRLMARLLSTTKGTHAQLLFRTIFSKIAIRLLESFRRCQAISCYQWCDRAGVVDSCARTSHFEFPIAYHARRLWGSIQLYAGQSTKHLTHIRDVPGPWENFPRFGRRDPRMPLTATVAARALRMSGGLEAVFYAEGENIYYGSVCRASILLESLLIFSTPSIEPYCQDG